MKETTKTVGMALTTPPPAPGAPSWGAAPVTSLKNGRIRYREQLILSLAPRLERRFPVQLQGSTGLAHRGPQNPAHYPAGPWCTQVCTNITGMIRGLLKSSTVPSLISVAPPSSSPFLTLSGISSEPTTCQQPESGRQSRLPLP